MSKEQKKAKSKNDKKQSSYQQDKDSAPKEAPVNVFRKKKK